MVNALVLPLMVFTIFIAVISEIFVLFGFQRFQLLQLFIKQISKIWFLYSIPPNADLQEC